MYSKILNQEKWVILRTGRVDGSINGIDGTFGSYGEGVNYIDRHYGDDRHLYGFQIIKLTNLD